MAKEQKKSYESPVLRELGKVEEMTQAIASGPGESYSPKPSRG